jgi:hypothetical protein
LVRLQNKYKDYLARRERAKAQGDEDDVEEGRVDARRAVLGQKVAPSRSVALNAPGSMPHVPLAERGNLPEENVRLRIHKDGQGASAVAQPSAWQDVGTEKLRHKENTREPVSWKGQTMALLGGKPRSTHKSKIPIYQDDARLSI